MTHTLICITIVLIVLLTVCTISVECVIINNVCLFLADNQESATCHKWKYECSNTGKSVMC